MSEFPKWPLVYVEWVDSTGGSSWVTLDGTDKLTPTVCVSVGWLANKDAASLTLYPDLAKHPSNKHAAGHGEQTIPIGCVKRIVKLKQPKGR